MTISDDHELMLRAMFLGDIALHDEVTERLRGADDLGGASVIVAAAFYEATHRRFGSGYTSAEIIRFVADQRIRFIDPDEHVDPLIAEQLLVAALSGAAVEGVSEQAKAQAEFMLLAGLVTDEDFDDDGLAEFLRRARQIADATVARPGSDIR